MEPPTDYPTAPEDAPPSPPARPTPPDTEPLTQPPTEPPTEPPTQLPTVPPTEKPTPPPSCRGPFEVYTVGISPCGNTCANYKKPCAIRTLVAIKGCDCIRGYARLSKGGKCVSIHDEKCVKQRQQLRNRCSCSCNEDKWSNQIKSNKYF